LTDENTYLSNRDKNTENNLMVSSDDIDLQDQIKNKERKLEQLIKEDKSRSEVEKLRSEIQRLKSQQKNNSTGENSTKNNNLITYSVIGIGLVALAGLAVLLVKPKQKSPKIK
jgi:CHASE3 domain sensor protein